MMKIENTPKNVEQTKQAKPLGKAAFKLVKVFDSKQTKLTKGAHAIGCEN